MMKSLHRLLFIVGLCIFGQPFAFADQGQDQDFAITVNTSGEMLIVDANFTVSATPHEAWDVLIDYDHMAEFLPNLQVSKIINAAGNKIQVLQKGKVSYGLLSFAFDSVREVELSPYKEIRSHVISGSIKQANGTTQLIPEGNNTRIIYHNESLPNFWLPPGIGPSFVKRETLEQFQDMKNEILRRKAAQPKINP